MDEEIRKSLLRIISISALHSERFRLAKLDLAAIPEDALRDMASDMLDLLETRVETWHRNPRPGTVLGAQPGDEGQRTKRRLGLDLAQ